MLELNGVFDLDAIEQTGKHSSVNFAAIQQMISVVRSATSRGGWWDTPKGKNATKALQGWGATVRERLITGDPTATPKSIGGGGAGSRSHGSMASIAMMAASVEGWVAGRTLDQRDLLSWIYVHGTEDRPVVVAYVLANGSVSDPVEASSPVPDAFQAYERCVSLFEAHIQTCSLRDYPDRLGIKPGIETWGMPWWTFVEDMHTRLGQSLVRELAL